MSAGAGTSCLGARRINPMAAATRQADTYKSKADDAQRRLTQITSQNAQLAAANDQLRRKVVELTELAGKPEEKRAWAVEQVKRAGRGAAALGLSVVNGFTGSSIWHLLYAFPPFDFSVIDKGFKYFAEMWRPILDDFQANGVQVARTDGAHGGERAPQPARRHPR